MTVAGRRGATALTADDGTEVRQLSNARRLVDALKRTPEFAGWPPQELARIVPYIWERHVRAGDVLCRKGEAAEYAFCLVEGTVRQTARGERVVSSGFFGHEVALSEPAYLADIVAVTNVVALMIPGALLRDCGVAVGGETLYHSLLAHHTTTPEVEAPPDREEAPESSRRSLVKSIGWVLTLILPTLVLALGESYGLSWQQRDFLSVLTVCLLLMSFDLTAQYAAALIAGLACLLLDVAPASVVLSGFASDGFFMVMSIFGLGAVLTNSGLAGRLVLNMLKRSPASPFWYNLIILLTGAFLTPGLPSANTRVALMTPLIMETSRNLGYRDRSREATRLMLSMFVGASLFAPIFLTAKSLNFVVYSQMPEQIRDQFQWLRWVMAAAPAALVMLVLYLILSALVFRGGEKPRLSKSHLEAQLDVLGPMRADEWTALTISFVFFVAIVSYSIHKISPAWITLAVLCIFLVLGTLHERHIRHNFQWDALLLVGFFIGLEQTLDYTGMTAMLTSHLSAVTDYMASDFSMFVVLVGLVTALLRLFLPITTAGVLIASVFLPLAELNGVNPWVVGFTIIMLSETWILPAQCSYFLTFEEVSGERPVHDRTLFLRMNAATMVIRVIALFASIPFFRYVGLL